MRRAAWEIYMAGCYQTTGETAKRGTGYWPDTGAKQPLPVAEGESWTSPQAAGTDDWALLLRAE
jgi:hypothetical protein